MQLANKIALITGAGSGIGKGTAIRFAREGAALALVGHTEDELMATADEIKRSGGRALPLVADVGDPHQMEQAIARAAEQLGGLDIVFANAGINGVWAPIEELEPAEWDRTIRTNLTGTYLTIHFAVPHLKKRNGGAIIVTSSVNGTRIFSNTGATAYSCTKAGQVAMAKMLALELAPFKIRVNVICPGAIETEIGDSTEKRDLGKVKIKQKFGTDVPLGDKPGTVEQVAELALFLVSEASSHITGTPVWIDGAQSLLQG